MQFSQFMCEELDLILKFPMDSMMQGLKVHQDADPVLVEAAKRLFEKGIIDQKDGGYLTDLGLDLAEHAQTLQSALQS